MRTIDITCNNKHALNMLSSQQCYYFYPIDNIIPKKIFLNRSLLFTLTPYLD